MEVTEGFAGPAFSAKSIELQSLWRFTVISRGLFQ